MARTRVMYIEQKTDGNRNLQHRGPAEIGEVSFSKTGKTIYYKGKSFERIAGGGVYGNYVCLEDGNEYWITGVKKKGNNRHWVGAGPVVDTTDGKTEGPIPEWSCDERVPVAEPISRSQRDLCNRNVRDMTVEQLLDCINVSTKMERCVKANKARRSWKQKREEAQAELVRRGIQIPDLPDEGT